MAALITNLTALATTLQNIISLSAQVQTALTDLNTFLTS